MRIILEFAKKYKCPGITIFPQNPRYVSNEQPCIKTTGLYDDLLFLPVSSIFPIPYSVLPFHLVHAFQCLQLFSLSLFFEVPSQVFIKCGRKASVYIYVYAAAAKSLQLCPTLCDPIDGSPPGSPVPGIIQAKTLELPFPSPMHESEK